MKEEKTTEKLAPSLFANAKKKNQKGRKANIGKRMKVSARYRKGGQKKKKKVEKKKLFYENDD